MEQEQKQFQHQEPLKCNLSRGEGGSLSCDGGGGSSSGDKKLNKMIKDIISKSTNLAGLTVNGLETI